MSLSAVNLWSTTPATNAGIHFPELQLPSTVNDDARFLMAEIKLWYDSISGGSFSGVVAGTADVITLTPTPAIPAYAVNQRFLFKTTGPNTVAAPTLNVSALGAKTLVGPGAAALAIPAWSTGDMVLCVYDGTNLQVLGLASSQAPQSIVRNAQTGATYTYLTGDRAKHVTHSNAGAIAGTLPQASASFPTGWFMWVENIGAGLLTITPTTSTINLGTALVLRQYEYALITSDGTNYRAVTTGQITGAPLVREAGTRGIPQNTQNSTYGFLLSDSGGHVFHDNATPHTWTIPANASVAFPIGAAITIINNNGAGALTIAITTDTLRRGDGTAGSGSRTVPADSVATLIKTKATEWVITGRFT